MTHDNSPPSDFGDDFDMSDPSGDGPTEPELTEAETIAAEDKVSGFVPSPELTAGQNAMRGDPDDRSDPGFRDVDRLSGHGVRCPWCGQLGGG